MSPPKTIVVVVLVAALVAALEGCGSTAHTSKNTLIIPDRSIGPISYAETEAKVEATYGKGQLITLKQGTARPRVVLYPAVSIGVIYEANAQGKPAVYIVETDAPQYRTKSGLGVGSTVGQLRKIGADCRPLESICGLGTSSSKPFTTFYLDNRGTRVVRVFIALLGG